MLKAGISAGAVDENGLSALDCCLIETRNTSGSEIDAWLKIATFLAQRATFRSKFTIPLLKLQADPRIFKQLWKLVGQPPLLLTTCLHKLRRSHIPALLQSRFLIRKADRGSDDEVEFNSNFIQVKLVMTLSYYEIIVILITQFYFLIRQGFLSSRLGTLDIIQKLQNLSL